MICDDRPGDWCAKAPWREGNNWASAVPWMVQWLVFLLSFLVFIFFVYGPFWPCEERGEHSTCFSIVSLWFAYVIDLYSFCSGWSRWFDDWHGLCRREGARRKQTRIGGE
jgi:hypothetical protein